jgi:hypothetical protein
MRSFAVVLCCIAILMLTACQEVKRECSNTLHEDAVIVGVVYTPSRHDSQVGLTAIKTGPTGIDYGGNLGIRVNGGLQISSVEVPEQFAVVFSCQHGQFIITRKEVYEKLKDHKGRTVDVAYREIYRTTYERKKDGEKQVVARELVGYDFLDATLK